MILASKCHLYIEHQCWSAKETNVILSSCITHKTDQLFQGYCGYCPMKKFQLGDTYGKTTADILTNDDVSNLSEPINVHFKIKVKDDRDRWPAST